MTSSTQTTLSNPSIFLSSPYKASISSRPIPEITSPHDIILRISYVGVCGSDVHFWTNGGIRTKVTPSAPLVLGHECTGIVHSTGSSVTSLKPGDRVAIEPGIPCRRCTRCKNGKYNLCPEMKFAACPPDNHGALTRFFKSQEDFCYLLPGGMGLDEGVLVEPLAVAVHAGRLAEVRVGNRVVVFGAGTVGLLCVRVALAMGAKSVVVVDVNRSRLEFAERWAGCGSFVVEKGKEPEATAKEISEKFGLDGGVDVVLEATGVESCIEAGIHLLSMGGTFIQVGLGKERIQFPIVAVSEKEATVRGCFRYGTGDFDMAMQFLREGKVSVKELISNVVPFEKATEAWEMTRKGEGIKNIICGPKD